MHGEEGLLALVESLLHTPGPGAPLPAPLAGEPREFCDPLVARQIRPEAPANAVDAVLCGRQGPAGLVQLHGRLGRPLAAHRRLQRLLEPAQRLLDDIAKE